MDRRSIQIADLMIFVTLYLYRNINHQRLHYVKPVLHNIHLKQWVVKNDLLLHSSCKLHVPERIIIYHWLFIQNIRISYTIKTKQYKLFEIQNQIVKLYFFSLVSPDNQDSVYLDVHGIGSNQNTYCSTNICHFFLSIYI